MITNDIAWKVGGEAGFGIMTLGAMFSKVLQRSGLHVATLSDYPSLIRGGHNTYYVRGSAEPIFSHLKPINILVAFNQETIEKDLADLTQAGALIFDPEKLKFDKPPKEGILLYPVPLNSLATKAGGAIFFNTVAFGASCGLLKIDFDIIKGILTDAFKKKGDEVVQKNISAAKDGYDALANKPFDWSVKKLPHEPTVLMTGNEAAGAGAIAAGVKFHGQYPMTPSSTILSFLAARERQFNLVVKHTEDEIAAINMAIGASFGGVRSMTATSGGGFSLMVEAVGLAALSETAIVIFESQRCGPSTGLPTYTEQADLQFILHASQGEFPRVVLAPGDVEECFFESAHAFNIADRVQTPVFVLLDRYLSETAFTAPKFDPAKVTIDRGKLVPETPDNRRHLFTPDGVSPRFLPGTPNGLYIASSYEHDETGWTSEDPVNRIKMIDKRARKLKLLENEIAPKVYGPAGAEVTLIVWGSTKLPAREAQRILEKEKIKTRVIHVLFLEPFPTKTMERLLRESKNLLILEANSTGQLRNLIREKTGIEIPNTYFKYDGRVFYPEDIVARVKEMI